MGGGDFKLRAVNRKSEPQRGRCFCVGWDRREGRERGHWELEVVDVFYFITQNNKIQLYRYLLAIKHEDVHNGFPCPAYQPKRHLQISNIRK
jgi:hypothetical protein